MSDGSCAGSSAAALCFGSSGAAQARRFLRLRGGAYQKLLPGLFGFFQLLSQLGSLLRKRVYLLGKRVVVCLRLLQTLLQTCQFDLKARIFSGKLIALVGQLAQSLLVLNGCRFDIIDNVGTVKAADRRAELLKNQTPVVPPAFRFCLSISQKTAKNNLPAAAFADFTNCSQTVVFHLYDCRYGKRLI